MMPKTLLVHLSQASTADRLLDVALPIAKRADAFVIGLVVLPPVMVVPAGTPGVSDPVLYDAERIAAQTFAADFTPWLGARLGAAGCRGALMIADAAASSTSDVLVERAAAVDLVVTAGSGSGWALRDAAEAPETLVLECGRPVLIVPPAATRTSLRKVLIAWDGEREAARALFDALPLLAAADAVEVLWIAPEREPYLANGLQPDDVVAMLARQGVEAKARIVHQARRATGDALLDEIEASGAELLVMGCYGHSRLREFVLGGVSRSVLEHATIPVLTSH